MGLGYSQTLPRGISHVSAVPAAAPGDRCLLDGNEYVYAYNRSSDLTAKVGYAMVASGVTGYSGVISGTTNIGAVLGVVKHADIPVGEYGWVLSKGFGFVAAGNNTGLAANDSLVLVGTTNTGNISRLLAQTAYSQVATPRAIGVVMVATGTGGIGEALFY